METKVCTKCLIEYPKTLLFFRKRGEKKSNKLRSICKKCFDKKQRERHIEFYKNNTEKELLRCKNWNINNPEKRRKTIRKTYLKNIVKNKQYDKKRRESLPDGKVSNILGFCLSEVPKELLETKRLLIQLKRELNSTNN